MRAEEGAADRETRQERAEATEDRGPRTEERLGCNWTAPATGTATDYDCIAPAHSLMRQLGADVKLVARAAVLRRGAGRVCGAAFFEGQTRSCRSRVQRQNRAGDEAGRASASS